MPRFVILSFLVLAWVFYELSGGADFVPRGLRPPPPEPRAEAAPPDRGTAAALATVTLKPKPAIAPRKVGSDPEPTMTAQARQAARLEQLRAGLAQNMGQTAGFTPGDGTAAGLGSGLELASLSQGAAGLHEAVMPEEEPIPAAETPVTEDPAADIRQITGLRVNMRDGPGTIYPVIARLQMGDEVEVLSESGTGWLRLRTLSGREVGWIAASLISKKAP